MLRLASTRLLRTPLPRSLLMLRQRPAGRLQQQHLGWRGIHHTSATTARPASFSTITWKAVAWRACYGLGLLSVVSYIGLTWFPLPTLRVMMALGYPMDKPNEKDWLAFLEFLEVHQSKTEVRIHNNPCVVGLLGSSRAEI